MDNIDITIPEFTIFFVIMIICCCCCRCTSSIETRHKKDLLFKDIREGEGCDKRFCPICLEEYKDDHEISQVWTFFHRFCIESWLKRKRSCPSCRRSV
ncbi:LOW QUALITY PROTEIN: hypothetical protein N665_0402s0011 [Sinapis alba]|nr:LOW QUALITY PROTEIN: hypothetical protein N665_0402s0011 [Sinapis alba]